jgi:2-dehydro-3-deoxyphosphogluconate aldolase / (4S)-4-hydroxy-2-oxoglutarate aldolase
MAQFTRLQVYQRLIDYPVVPVFNHPDIQVCQNVLAACYRGGLRIFEYTNRQAFSHEVFGDLVKFAQKHFPDMILGAGTIMDAGSASLFIQQGASFIVSPVLKEDIAITCHRRKIGWIPGVGSLSEISRAEELGAEIVKLFPGSFFKPDFVKAVLSPMPWVSIMVTGGVQPTEENLSAWFGAGVVCVGMGDKLIPQAAIDANDYSTIEQRAKLSIELAHKFKK